MKQLLLLVDDDNLPMKFYIKALEQSGFEVKHFREPDSALAFIKENSSQIKVVVFDIMMPPGQTYKNQDTHHGLKTGVFLLEDIRKYCPNTPIVVLTNLNNPETLKKFQEGPLLSIKQKMECAPYQLVDIVKGFTNN